VATPLPTPKGQLRVADEQDFHVSGTWVL
jgi:hypothetical protein